MFIYIFPRILHDVAPGMDRYNLMLFQIQISTDFLESCFHVTFSFSSLTQIVLDQFHKMIHSFNSIIDVEFSSTLTKGESHCRKKGLKIGSNFRRFGMLKYDIFTFK